MQISIIVAHPNPHSFNHAIAQTAISELEQNAHTIFFHDLYAEKFNPVLPYHEIPKGAPLPKDIESYCKELSSSDGIIIVHPNWWGQPPAILKGWVDRVIRPGIAYHFLDGDSGEGIPVGLMKARAALIFNTSNTPAERETTVFKDPLETLWKNCIFDLCGVQTVYREMFGVIVISTEEQRKEWLIRVRKVVTQYFPKQSFPTS